MATELAKAYVQIIPSTEGIKGMITEALDSEAEKAGKQAGEKTGFSFGSAFSGALKVGGALIGATAALTSALTGAIVSGTVSVSEYGDEIDKISQKMGLSAQAYQEWDAIMRHSGTSISTLQSGMKTLANAVENGNKAFERLGISQEMIAGMDNEQLFSATITALQNVDNETERTYLAGQLLGRGATELGALLNTSAEDTEAMRQRVHELGGVMSDDAVKGSAALQDSIQDMQTAFSGMSRGVLVEFLPGLKSVTDGLTEIFTGNGHGGIAMISEGVGSIATKITEKAPLIVDAGSQIVLSIGKAITNNLPTLLTAGGNAVATVATGISEMLPEVVATGLDVITSFAQGVADNIPEIAPTIVDIMLSVVDTLTDPTTLANLVDAAIAIIVGLATGLINALPKLLEKVPEIIANIITVLIENTPKLFVAALEIIAKLAEGLIDNLSGLGEAIGEIVGAVVNGLADSFVSFLEAGQQIVSGIWQGIKGRADWFGEQVKGFFGGIVDGAKKALGIASPSKVFAEIGGFMAEGMAVGIEENTDLVRSAVTDLAKDAANVDVPDFAVQTAVRSASSQMRNSDYTPSTASADTLAGVVNAIQTAVAGIGGGTANITLTLDGAVVARGILQNLINVARSNGTPIVNMT